MDSVGQCSGVDMEEAHRSTAIRISRKHGRDVGAEIIVGRMSDGYAVDDHRDSGPIDGYYARQRCESPAEVH